MYRASALRPVRTNSAAATLRLHQDYFGFSIFDMADNGPMLGISGAQLEPLRDFHYFHEELNVYVKVSIASAVLLSTHAADPGKPRFLGGLIGSAHPAWNMPPIHEFDLEHQRNIYRSTSAFAIVSLFSAFDDFMTGIEADQHRSRGERIGAVAIGKDVIADDSDQDRIFKIYVRNGWSSKAVENYRPVIKYFRLIRDCIAHRSSRASEALEKHSADPKLQTLIKPFLERTTVAAPTFKWGDQIFIDPTLAITCSDMLRKVAIDCNGQLMDAIGEVGFLRIVAHNIMLGDRLVRTDAYKTPEAVLNLALTERYRATLPDRLYASAQLKNMGIWKEFNKKFKRLYQAKKGSDWSDPHSADK